MDIAMPMLRQARPRSGWNPLQKPIDHINDDARALPLVDGSVDVLFCNLCLHWVDNLSAAFAGFRRVLRPGGLLLVSTFGTDKLQELRAAFAAADDRVPTESPFTTLADFCAGLQPAGHRDPR